MEALLPSFIAAALAEFGDKTQLVMLALATSSRRPGSVLAGLAAAILVSNLVAAYAGTLIHDAITLRAGSLFLALALGYAGVAGLIGVKPPKPIATGKLPLALVAFICLLAGELGDKTQFLTAGFAVRFDSLLLVSFAAAAGVLVANIFVLALARSAVRLPLVPLRMGSALLLLLSAVLVALDALRLI